MTYFLANEINEIYIYIYIFTRLSDQCGNEPGSWLTTKCKEHLMCAVYHRQNVDIHVAVFIIVK